MIITPELSLNGCKSSICTLLLVGRFDALLFMQISNLQLLFLDIGFQTALVYFLQPTFP